MTGWFLSGRSPKPDAERADAPPQPEPEAHAPAWASAVTARSLAALAKAIAPVAFHAAQPRLQPTGRHSVAATLSDLETGWAAYWLSELRLPVEPARLAWRRAVVLQALYEAGVLRAGGPLRWSGHDAVLDGYLKGLGFHPAAEEPAAVMVCVEGPPAPAEAVRPSGVLVWTTSWREEAEIRRRCADLEAQGWMPWPLHLDRLDHALDNYLQPESAGGAGGPDLAREQGGRAERDFVFVAERAA